jgi:hypothetical protein
MSVAPADIHPSPPSGQITERHWQLAAVVALFVLALIVVGLAVRLDDDSSAPSNGVTTARSQIISSVDGLSGSDLGGAVQHRSGNQP